jgi:hypothetical protein
MTHSVCIGEEASGREEARRSPRIDWPPAGKPARTGSKAMMACGEEGVAWRSDRVRKEDCGWISQFIKGQSAKVPDATYQPTDGRITVLLIEKINK